jgi:DNA ligase 4
MGETVDVLVLGEYLEDDACRLLRYRPTAGNFGSGKRGGGVSTLICAVRDDRNQMIDEDEPKCVFFSLLVIGVLLNSREMSLQV